MKKHTKILLPLTAFFLSGVVLSAQAITTLVATSSQYKSFDVIGDVAAYKDTPTSSSEQSIETTHLYGVPITKLNVIFSKLINPDLSNLQYYTHVTNNKLKLNKPGTLKINFYTSVGSTLPNQTCLIKFEQKNFKVNRTITLPNNSKYCD